MARQDVLAPQARRHKQAVLDGHVVVGVHPVNFALGGAHQRVHIGDHHIRVAVHNGAGHFRLLQQVHQEAVQPIQGPGRFKNPAHIVANGVTHLAVEGVNLGGQAVPAPTLRLGPARPAFHLGSRLGFGQWETGIFFIGAEFVAHLAAVTAPAVQKSSVGQLLAGGADEVRRHNPAVHPQQAQQFLFVPRL